MGDPDTPNVNTQTRGLLYNKVHVDDPETPNVNTQTRGSLYNQVHVGDPGRTRPDRRGEIKKIK